MMGALQTTRLAMVLLATVQMVSWTSAASAQEWPTRPIRLVIPFAAGGITDLLGRIVGNEMSKRLGQPVVLENKPGAAGLIGTEYVARAEPDGYTLCLCTSGPLTVAPSLDVKLSYDPQQDLVPVSHLISITNVFVAKNELPVSTFSEFINLARSKPGVLTYGSPGANGTQHLAMTSLLQMANIDLVHIPFKGETPLLTDMMGGQIDSGLVTMAGAEPLVKSGKIRALVVMTMNRDPQLPDVPSIAEVGYPAASLYNFLGINVPRGTPQPIVEKLATTIQALMRDSDIQKQIRSRGAEPIGSSPAEYAAMIKREGERWKRVIESMKNKKP